MDIPAHGSHQRAAQQLFLPRRAQVWAYVDGTQNKSSFVDSDDMMGPILNLGKKDIMKSLVEYVDDL